MAINPSANYRLTMTGKLMKSEGPGKAETEVKLPDGFKLSRLSLMKFSSNKTETLRAFTQAVREFTGSTSVLTNGRSVKPGEFFMPGDMVLKSVGGNAVPDSVKEFGDALISIGEGKYTDRLNESGARTGKIGKPNTFREGILARQARFEAASRGLRMETYKDGLATGKPHASSIDSAASDIPEWK